MTRAVMLAALALSYCDGTTKAPSPTPTIPTVTAGPVHAEAGTECGVACEHRKNEGCPNGGAPKTLEHCVAICTAGRVQLADPSADCLALIATCNEKCKP